MNSAKKAVCQVKRKDSIYRKRNDRYIVLLYTNEQSEQEIKKIISRTGIQYLGINQSGDWRLTSTMKGMSTADRSEREIN